MDASEYIKEAARTNTKDYSPVRKRLSQSAVPELLHAAMGISTESGELMDALKKHFMYGKDLDEINLMEELGDILWYVALAADTLGLSFEQIFDRNIAKLRARFPEKFTEKDALVRDLSKERRILEG